MNISFNVQNPYPYFNNGISQGNSLAQGNSLRQGNSLVQGIDKTSAVGKNRQGSAVRNQAASYFDKVTDRIAEDNSRLDRQMRQMVRALKQNPVQGQQTAGATLKDKTNGFLELAGSPDAAEEGVESSENYNYKEVASKIQSAKNSNSAGQAVLAAKRAVSQIKRKMSSGDGDADELRLALTHAKRMEMVARKKKHNLELEEMVDRTQKRDESADRQEKAANDMKSAIVQAEEEKITEKEDAIFEEREDMMDEALEQMEESGISATDEMMQELNQMISEFGEEELKELEESMELLENMEVVDPHMSEEDLENLKRKHRASENKAITKANMEYLKEMIKHEMGKAGKLPGMGGSTTSGINQSKPQTSFMPAGDAAIPSVDMPASPADGGTSINVSV